MKNCANILCSLVELRIISYKTVMNKDVWRSDCLCFISFQRPQQLQQSSLVLIHLSDRSGYNISEPCWYSISTSLRIEEKLNTDQADWPLIEGMSLWLCGMKCDWLKGGNHSLGRQSCTTECHFTWLIFLDLHAFKVNWFLIHACACTTQEHRSISSLMLAPTLTCFRSPLHRCETQWSEDGRNCHCPRLRIPLTT